MKWHLLIALFFLVASVVVQAQSLDEKMNSDLALEQTGAIKKVEWMHGSMQCDKATAVPIDSYWHDDTSLILRQNKCLTYEAPFLYVLTGSQAVMVLDSGALDSQSGFSLYQELESLLGKETLSRKKIIVVHSHGHSDHYQGDSDLQGRANVELVGVSATDVRAYFGFKNWPSGEASIDLGGRVITVIPTPGHQEESLSFYDTKTQWLMTGDTVYPGLIYVKDWAAYRKSVERLVSFSNEHTVSAVMGAHIEMENNSDSYYPIGSTFQPNEARLELPAQSLLRLHEVLSKDETPREIVFEGFILMPMNAFQRTVSNVFRWFSQ